MDKNLAQKMKIHSYPVNLHWYIHLLLWDRYLLRLYGLLGFWMPGAHTLPVDTVLGIWHSCNNKLPTLSVGAACESQ